MKTLDDIKREIAMTGVGNYYDMAGNRTGSFTEVGDVAAGSILSIKLHDKTLGDLAKEYLNGILLH